jgi:hypothetical protein
MYKLYEDNQSAAQGGDFSLLAETHASSSALKSLCTITAANAIETCRRACGGGCTCHRFEICPLLIRWHAQDMVIHLLLVWDRNTRTSESYLAKQTISSLSMLICYILLQPATSYLVCVAQQCTLGQMRNAN